MEFAYYEKDAESVLLRQLFGCSHALPRIIGENNSQRRTLALLDHGESFGEVFNQKRLAELMGIRQPSMSELLAKLEDKGYIRREKDDLKRSVYIRITQEGKSVLAEMEAEHTDTLRNLFAALSDHEREALSSLLQKLLDSWEMR